MSFGGLPNMLRLFAAVLFAFVFFGCAARAEVECYPHCDYWHDYGPYDFTYIRPGLYGFPRCGPRGDCSPYLVYTYPRYRYDVTIRARSAPLATRRRP